MKLSDLGFDAWWERIGMVYVPERAAAWCSFCERETAVKIARDNGCLHCRGDL